MNTIRNRLSRKYCARGFTLVELLVVIGIIALLISMLLPALAKARQQGKTVRCMSNMRQVGLELMNYSNQWKGAMFPPNLGDNQPENNRWPVFVFDPPVYNPPEMLCPNDENPAFDHSYILNAHLSERQVTYSDTRVVGVSPSDVVVMGEKNSDAEDYYMNAVAGDYTTKVDFYKHGAGIGSNYLYLDMHVETDPLKEAELDIDPWDPAAIAITP